jgi:hypothetical protein
VFISYFPKSLDRASNSRKRRGSSVKKPRHIALYRVDCGFISGFPSDSYAKEASGAVWRFLSHPIRNEAP